MVVKKALRIFLQSCAFASTEENDRFQFVVLFLWQRLRSFFRWMGVENMRSHLAILCVLLLALSACGNNKSVRISEEEAYLIACEYWDYTEGDVAPETGFELVVVPDPAGALRTEPESGAAYYHYTLKWRVVGEDGSTWLSTCDDVRIDAKTGQCSCGK